MVRARPARPAAGGRRSAVQSGGPGRAAGDRRAPGHRRAVAGLEYPGARHRPAPARAGRSRARGHARLDPPGCRTAERRRRFRPQGRRRPCVSGRGGRGHRGVVAAAALCRCGGRTRQWSRARMDGAAPASRDTGDGGCAVAPGRSARCAIACIRRADPCGVRSTGRSHALAPGERRLAPRCAAPARRQRSGGTDARRPGAGRRCALCGAGG